jgi:hypothetical protein
VISIHDVKVIDGAIDNRNNHNPVILAQTCGVSNSSGSAGVTVTTAVTFTETLPSTYSVTVQPGQGVGWFISAKVAKGFSVNLVPFSAGVSVAAGSFDVTVIAA